MSVEKLDLVKEEGFPLLLKKLVNRCASRLNRKWEFLFDTNSKAAIIKVIETEEKVIVTIPRGSGGGSATNSPWILLPGTEPGTVRVGPNSTLMASASLDSEWTITDIGEDFPLDAGQLLYLDLAINSSLVVTGVTLTGGDPWTEFPGIYATTGAGTLLDPFVVTNAYFPLGQAVADDENSQVLDGVSIGDGVRVVRMNFVPLIVEFFNAGSGQIIPYPRAHTRPAFVE